MLRDVDLQTVQVILNRLVRNGRISNELALSRCQDPAEYKRFLQM